MVRVRWFRKVQLLEASISHIAQERVRSWEASLNYGHRPVTLRCSGLTTLFLDLEHERRKQLPHTSQQRSPPPSGDSFARPSQLSRPPWQVEGFQRVERPSEQRWAVTKPPMRAGFRMMADHQVWVPVATRRRKHTTASPSNLRVRGARNTHKKKKRNTMSRGT